MAHDKVYGKCENYCDVEVIAKENLMVLFGDSVTIEANQDEMCTITPPENFRAVDYVIVGAGRTESNYGRSYVNFTDPTIQNVFVVNAVIFTNSSINVTLKNNTSSSSTVRPYVVLMKR